MLANRKVQIDYTAMRNSQTCFCGRFKWRGFSFCKKCIDRLPPGLGLKLYGAKGERYAAVYEACKAVLIDAGVKDFAEAGKL